MDRNVLRFCLGDLLNKLGDSLTLYGGMLYLAFYSEKQVWFALLIGANIVATLLATRLKALVKTTALSVNIKRLLSLQFLCMLTLFFFYENLILFVGLFFLKAVCRVVYGGLIQSALPRITEHHNQIHSANKVLSVTQSMTFLASIGLSGVLLELVSLKGLFIIDALSSLLPLLMFRWFFPLKDFILTESKEESPKITLSFQEILNLYPILHFVFAGTFALFLIAGGGTIVEILYYKNTLHLSPMGISALMLLAAMGHLLGSILLKKHTVEYCSHWAPIFVAVTMNITLLTIFFHQMLFVIGFSLFIYGFLNGVFTLVVRQMIYNTVKSAHHVSAFLYQSFTNNFSQLVSLFIVGMIGTTMTDRFIMGLLVLISMIVSLMIYVLKFSSFKSERLKESW